MAAYDRIRDLVHLSGTLAGDRGPIGIPLPTTKPLENTSLLSTGWMKTILILEDNDERIAIFQKIVDPRGGELVSR